MKGVCGGVKCGFGFMSWGKRATLLFRTPPKQHFGKPKIFAEICLLNKQAVHLSP